MTLAALVAVVLATLIGQLSTMDGRPVGTGVTVGAVLGGALVVEGTAELAFSAVSDANVGLGYAIVAAMVLAYTVSGLIAGVGAAVWTALVAHAVSYPALWLAYVLGGGTAAFTRVLRAEGDFDDFHRSGYTDFHVFLLRDFLGADFFHLLFGVALALIAGAGAGGVRAAFRRRVEHPTEVTASSAADPGR